MSSLSVKFPPKNNIASVESVNRYNGRVVLGRKFGGILSLQELQKGDTLTKVLR
jgi:hypothetical protein